MAGDMYAVTKGAQDMRLSSQPKSRGWNLSCFPGLKTGQSEGPASTLPGPTHLSDSLHSHSGRPPAGPQSLPQMTEASDDGGASRKHLKKGWCMGPEQGRTELGGDSEGLGY